MSEQPKEPIATIVLDKDGYVVRVDITPENKQKLAELRDTRDDKIIEANR